MFDKIELRFPIPPNAWREYVEMFADDPSNKSAAGRNVPAYGKNGRFRGVITPFQCGNGTVSGLIFDNCLKLITNWQKLIRGERVENVPFPSIDDIELFSCEISDEFACMFDYAQFVEYATVVGLEIGQNIPISAPPAAVFPFLLRLSKYERTQIGDGTLMFEWSGHGKRDYVKRIFTLYDKRAERIAKGYGDVLAGCAPNILRCESRANYAVRKAFHSNTQMNFGALAKHDVQNACANSWANTYRSILKCKIMPQLEKLTPSACRDILMHGLIMETGGLEYVEREFTAWREGGLLTKTNEMRTRQMIEKIMQTGADVPPLIAELDEKIAETVERGCLDVSSDAQREQPKQAVSDAPHAPSGQTNTQQDKSAQTG